MSLLLLAPLLLGQAGPSPSAVPQPVALDIAAGVFHDIDEAGRLWARGTRWKMRFGPAQATFFPLFGPDQERHHPVELSLASVSLGALELPLALAGAPARAGDRVACDRGLLTEVYELASESVEQSFVFPVVPRGDDLVLRIETGCDLPATEEVSGLELHHPLGRLGYSRALAMDGLGRELPLETRLDGRAIVVRVPAWYLDAAAAPLVVDPVLSVTWIPGDEQQNQDADVAYDATTQRWLVVWQSHATETDWDVSYAFLDDGGQVLSNGYLNLDTQNWTAPSVANLSAFDGFYAAAQVSGSGVASAIKGRALPALAPPGSSGGPVYQLSVSAATKLQPAVQSQAPAVGGNASADPAYAGFGVVWLEKVSGVGSIRFRRVDAQGVPLGAVAVSGAGGATVPPSISMLDGALEWTVAYVQSSPASYRLALARIAWNGQVTQPPATLPYQGDLMARLAISPGGLTLLGTRSGSLGFLQLVLAGTQVLDAETLISAGDPYIDFDFASDGSRFAVGCSDSQCFAVGTLAADPATGQLSLLEAVPVDCLPSWANGVATRAESGGAPGLALHAYTALWIGGTHSEVVAVFYQPQ